MVNRSGSPKSLLDVWKLYALETQATQSEKQAYAKLTQVKTALIRYTLPFWGLPSLQGNKVTEFETEQAFGLMSRISLKQLQSALLAQHQVFEQQEVPDKIRRTYRSALKQLLTWCQQQEWAWVTTDSEQQLLVPPKRRKRSAQVLHVRKKDTSDEQVRQKYRYGLGSVEGDLINEQLQKELAEFAAFRQNSSLKGFELVKASTLNRELAGIRLILGWLHRTQGIRNEDLSLTRIVSLVSLNTPNDQAPDEQAKAAARESLALAYKYIHWLRAKPEEGGRGLTTQQVELSNLKIFKSVACFLYSRERPPDSLFYTESKLRQIPVIQAFNDEINRWQTRASTKVRGQSEDKFHAAAITTWTEVLAFVEKLRAECTPRLQIEQQTRKQAVSFGPLRSLPAIAQSYQRFLLCALMSYLPPQRQQEYRNLLFDQNHSLELKEASSYIYTENSKWYITVSDKEDRLARAQCIYHVEIPNIQYPDGRYFYQYLQEWLYEYKYLDAEGKERKTDGLRAALKPQHSFLFTKKNGKSYTAPTELSRLVRDAAFRLTGKTINPERFRKIFVTHILKQNPTSDVWQVLAVLMRLSLKMQMEAYEKLLGQAEKAKVVFKEAENIAQALVSRPH